MTTVSMGGAGVPAGQLSGVVGAINPNDLFFGSLDFSFSSGDSVQIEGIDLVYSSPAIGSALSGNFTTRITDNQGAAISNSVLVSGTVAAVPEPSSTALLGLGGLALVLRRRR